MSMEEQQQMMMIKGVREAPRPRFSTSWFFHALDDKLWAWLTLKYRCKLDASCDGKLSRKDRHGRRHGLCTRRSIRAVHV